MIQSMIWSPFKAISKRFLGVDIGTEAVKIVELSKFGSRIRLESYGELSAPAFYEKPFRTFDKNTLSLSGKDTAKAVLAILEEAKINTKEAIMSIPDFSSFFTWFELPKMSKEELSQAVRYEAHQHIPVPLSEITLDWQIIEGRIGDGQKSPLRILLVAVPTEVINQYQEIARLTELELKALEAEVFGFLKSSIPQQDEREVVALIDIGAQSTTCSIVEKGVLQRSHSIDLAGNNFTSILSQALSVDYKEAEKLKKEQGTSLTNGSDVDKVLMPLLDFILTEVGKIFQSFSLGQKKEIKKVILGGGSALLPGLREYFQDRLGKETEIADPFANVFYPPILEKEVKKMGPAYAIAVGMALRGLE